MSAMVSSVQTALDALDWNSLSRDFLRTTHTLDRVTAVLERSAIWARQIEEADVENPALPFIRMSQIESYHAVALMALALYKPAAVAMRAMLESNLYYIYFRTHPSELATLAQSDTYFVDKTEILEYMELHLPKFGEKQKCFDLKNEILKWYKKISGLVHGQIPETWISYTSLTQVAHQKKYLEEALGQFEKVDTLTHHLRLVALSDLWRGFDVTARKFLLRGLSPSIRGTLGLSLA